MDQIVDSSGAQGWQRLQTALSEAQPGDVVRLQSGVYTGTGSLSPAAGVSLVGASGAVLVRVDRGATIEVSRDAVRLIDLRVVAGSAAQILVQVSRCNDVRVEHCGFDGVGVACMALAAELATDVSVSNCRIEGCADAADEPGVACVRFSASTGEVLDCDIVGGWRGVLAGRCPSASTVPSVLRIARCRVSSTWSHALTFSSSQCTAEDNECSGCRTGCGIAVQRDVASTSEASEVMLRGNRCHDNEEAGIVFLSGRGEAIDNECSGSRTNCGIAIERDWQAPTEPSQMTLKGNRCHNNESAGIAFFSGQGEAVDNDCSGSRASSGIVAQRDLHSPTEPSVVYLRGNRCHQNFSAGIAFWSSRGAAVKNECWGSRTGSGIVAQRDPYSPTECSEVIFRGNRCHDNESAGIVFFSSRGRAVDNECWGSRTSSGIVAQRDAQSPTEPSEVLLRGNRCHDNESAGIVFFSSRGRAVDNECWGSRTSSGIVAQRDAQSPTEPSEVLLRGNRCHDNESAGIVFLSSRGRAVDNECWGSRTSSGIVAQRDSLSASQASEVDLRGNRCHHNYSAGIVFWSSRGDASDNECWGSQASCGIVVQRDLLSPNVPSKVILRSNRCHHNRSAGIAFLSSQGEAMDNECWSSRASSGIVAERDPRSPTEPSEVTLRGNRCHDNDGAGIAFIASRGAAQGNECWGNQDDAVGGLDPAHVSGHVTKPSVPPWELERRRLRRHRMHAWLTAPGTSALAAAQRPALADFLGSGCTHCFEHFWLGTVEGSASTGIETRDEDSRVPHGYRLQRLSAKSGDANGVPALRVARLDAAELFTSVPGTGIEVLNALLKRMGRQRRRQRSGSNEWLKGWRRRDDAPATEVDATVVGLVSADESALDEWLRDVDAMTQRLNASKPRERKPAWRGTPSSMTLHLRVFDLLPLGLQSPSGAVGDGFLATQLLAGRRWPERWATRLRAWAQVPLSALAVSMTVSLAGWMLVLVGLLGLDGLALLDTWQGWQAVWPKAAQAGSKAWSDLLSEWKLGGVVLGLLCVLCFAVIPVSRLLPRELSGVRVRWLNAIDVLFEQWAFLEFLRPIRKSRAAARLYVWLGEWLHSPACRRAWLRRELFDEPLFGPWRPKARPAAVLVLRHVDVVSDSYLADMRLMLALRPPGQPAMLLTQMASLSMVLSGFVDVWLPADAVTDRVAHLLHDPRSLTITTELLDEPQKEAAEPLSLLADLLGWPSQAAAGGQARDTWVAIANALEGPRPVPRDWALMLVLGSLPQAHLMLSRRHVSPEDPDVAEDWKRYLFALPGHHEWSQPQGDWLRELDAEVDRGRAVLRVIEGGRRAVWVGRAGARLELARALRDRFDGSRNSMLRYLAGCLAGAERLHLQLARENLAASGPASRTRSCVSRGLLHAEAAFALTQERHALTISADADSLLAGVWAELGTELRAERPPMGGTNVLRLWGSLLGAERLYAQASGAAQPLHQAALADGLSALLPQGCGAWGEFMALLWMLPRRLAALDARLADETLALLFRRDWLPLAASLQHGVAKSLQHWRDQCPRNLLDTSDAEALLADCTRLAGRPALVVGVLARMSTSDLREPVDDATQAAWADALIELRQAAGGVARCERLPSGLRATSRQATAAARQLLIDPHSRQRLARALANGGKVLERVSTLDHEGIDGMALGTHNQLHTLLHLGQQAEDFVLGELRVS